MISGGGLSDTELILVVLGVIYLIESCAWLRDGNVAFVSFLGRFRLRTSSPIANDRGGVVFGSPLPFDQTLFGEPWPIAISPDGILSYSSTSIGIQGNRRPEPIHLAFDDIKSVEADANRIRVNGQIFASLRSPASASALRQAILDVRKRVPGERAKELRKLLRATTDTSRIDQAMDKLQRATAMLRFVTGLLFGQIFFIGPFLYYTYHAADDRYWILFKFLVLSGVCWLAICLIYYLSHRKLYPTNVAQRRKQVLTYLVSPASALRSADLLGRDTFVLTHPLALACRLCRQVSVHELARRVWIDYRHPLPPTAPLVSAEARAVLEWYRIELGVILSEFLHSLGLDPAELLLPPSAADSGAITYCPRCQRQFVLAAGHCDDCGGMELRSFAEKAEPTQETIAPNESAKR
jgi:hypothetical protein